MQEINWPRAAAMRRQEILHRVKTPTAAGPVVIGHRGLKMNLAPDELVRENTLHSFHSGIAAGATFVEFDVQVPPPLKCIMYIP
jgi:glycerophosphoryl diester phosphodiesterase